MGGDVFYCRQDRLHSGDAAALGTAGRERQGRAGGATTAERERIKALERELRELRQANELLRKASAFGLRRSSTARSSDEGAH